MISSLETLEKEIKWLSDVVAFRFADYFKAKERIPYPEPPDLEEDKSFYAREIIRLEAGITERLLVLIALAPHIKPAVLDIFFTKNSDLDRVFTEFGGLKGEKHSGFIPTGETAVFIIAGDNLEKRMDVQRCLDDRHPLYKNNILMLGETSSFEPIWSGELSITKEFLTKVTLAEPYKPRFSSAFPAKLLETQLSWDDVIFERSLMNEIEVIKTWISNEVRIMEEWKLGKYLKQGYRALFYGPPGTGKSMTAALLGESCDLEVYRVDISAVVSKYIGETEKNLAHLFDMAENKNWLLFFDEADALFSRRLSATSSNDKFANQQVAYLLQRVEDFNGLVILASNFKDNIDEAFLRRFQSIIHFPKPNANLRRKLWDKYFDTFELQNVDIEKISEDYEISGGSIINVLRHCSIVSATRNDRTISEQDIIKGIKKEFKKEGVTM